MNHHPKVSIVTVCYNSEKYIEDCIKSIMRQTYDNVEHIIVDGGSTDGTLDIIKNMRISIICAGSAKKITVCMMQ